MPLSDEDIDNIANLARLELSKEQHQDMHKSLNDIMGLIEQMQAINTDGVEPMAHPLDMVQRLRADEVTEPNMREEMQAIAPKTEHGLYLVPPVIE